MHCDYKISRIIDVGNSVEVLARFYEGEYQDVYNEIEDKTTNQYVRSAMIYECSLWFEKSPTLNSDIETELKIILNDIKGSREVITECQ